MTQEDKKLLLKDLCTRLPYETIVQVNDWVILDTTLKTGHITRLMDDDVKIKPYLRPMSSMTEEEKKEYDNFLFDNLEREDVIGYEDKAFGIDVIMRYRSWDVVQWLLEHHLDFNGLIDLGLAIEAPEGMYNLKFIKYVL